MDSYYGVRVFGPSLDRPSRLALVVMLSCCASCSLLKLDEFDFPACGACESLNARDGVADDACARWQCDAQQRECAFGPLDADGDAHVAARCGGDDCDDASGATFPGAAELCNGQDDDCNGLLDDASAPVVAPVVVVEGVGTPAFSTYAGLPEGIGVAWASGTSAAMARVTQVASPTVPSAALGLRTNEDPTRALTSAATRDGFPREAAMTLLPFACGAGDTCAGDDVCIVAPDGQHLCERPVVHTATFPPTECRTHAECQDGLACNGAESCAPTEAALGTNGCRAVIPALDPCTATGAVCDEARNACISYPAPPASFADFALARLSGDEWLAVPLLGRCAAGAVQPGLIDLTESAPSVLARGDGRLSATWLGVDVSSDGCTGASRTPALLGAAGIAVAALDANVAQGRYTPTGLAAWRAAPVCSGVGGCAAVASARVEVLGLWAEHGTAGGDPIRWVSATGDGVPDTADGKPVVLGDESAGRRIDVASWETPSAAGWLVAYPRAGGGAALSVIDSLPLPAPLCTASPVCVRTDDLSTHVDAGAGRRDTPALTLLGGLTFDEGAALTSDVAVAAFAAGAMVEVALAWATATEVVLARGSYDPSTGALIEGEHTTWPATGAGDVAVVHASGGLAVVGATLGGVVVEGARSGGLVLTWATPTGTFAARVADATGQQVGSSAVRIGDTSDTPRAFVDTGDGAAQVRVIARQGGAFVALRACGI